jgi:hypothetical protein
MKMTSVDQIVKENAILIKDNPNFVEEKKHLQMALSYMSEENSVWKFKSSVPTANAMNIKNLVGRDNIRMKEIAQRNERKNKSGLNSWVGNDKTKKWILIALAVGAVGVGVYLFMRKKRTNGTQPQQTSSVFDTIMKRPTRTPKKVIRKMVVEEFNNTDSMDISDDGISDEGTSGNGETA